MHAKGDLQKTRGARQRWIAAVIAFVACVAAAVAIYLGAAQDTSAQAEQAIRQAILDSAKQCAAIEGSYPSSLDYLEKRYGLSVNHKDYVITYEAFASNLVPEVEVTAR